MLALLSSHACNGKSQRTEQRASVAGDAAYVTLAQLAASDATPWQDRDGAAGHVEQTCQSGSHETSIAFGVTRIGHLFSDIRLNSDIAQTLQKKLMPIARMIAQEE